MGGYGSGAHKRSNRDRVEDCQILSLPKLLQSFTPIDEPGYRRWEFSKGFFSYSIQVDITRIGPDRLRYFILNTEQAINLHSTALHFGGSRWWFECPRCSRRCSILYLPPFASKYLCRICHDLRYGSASFRTHILIARHSGESPNYIKFLYDHFMESHKKPFVRKRDRRPDYHPRIDPMMARLFSTNRGRRLLEQSRRREQEYLTETDNPERQGQ